MHIIERFENVKETGSGRWLARCPAHDDKSPSLAIRECADGTILLHCFAGCDVASITAAIGVELTDLFPANDTHHRSRERRPFNAIDVLRATAFEARIAALACADVVSGIELTESDLSRVLLAQQRLQNALSIAEGK